MKTRLLSALLIFLLVASFSVPAVSAETPQVYYELHNLCACNAKEDLGKLPYLTWGIGYEAWIDEQNDNWEVFAHAGVHTKKFTITNETETEKMVTLMDFVEYVDECKAEMDQIPDNAYHAVISSAMGSTGLIGGAVLDNAPAVAAGVVTVSYSVEQIAEFTTHFNNAKNAQKCSEKLFERL